MNITVFGRIMFSESSSLAVTKDIFITVKTYPTLSTKRGELVCTAGITWEGEWIRLYPIPFRNLPYDEQYRKFQWVKVCVIRNEKDFRPESFRVIDQEIKPGKVITSWKERNKIIFHQGMTVYTNLDSMIREAKTKSTSLAIFKPSVIHDMIVEPTEREWDADKLAAMKARKQQLTLFQTEDELTSFFVEHVKKLPYKFSYRFSDDAGHESTLMIEDWEIGALYWNCLKRCSFDEKKAVEQVLDKYRSFSEKDIYFFMGTTLQFHQVSSNPFIIIGVYYPPFLPRDKQQSLW